MSDLREKIAERLRIKREDEGKDECGIPITDFVKCNSLKNCERCYADVILSDIATEVEGMENPSPKCTTPYCSSKRCVSNSIRRVGAEEFRQAILKKLKDNNEQTV